MSDEAPTVWLVHRGCRYEGGAVRIAASTRQVGIWYARWFARNSGYTKYKRVRGTDTWEAHSDFITVYPQRVY